MVPNERKITPKKPASFSTPSESDDVACEKRVKAEVRFYLRVADVD
jgi:hypothetical protein